jgi:hypothetical protein
MALGMIENALCTSPVELLLKMHCPLELVDDTAEPDDKSSCGICLDTAYEVLFEVGFGCISPWEEPNAKVYHLMQRERLL